MNIEGKPPMSGDKESYEEYRKETISKNRLSFAAAALAGIAAGAILDQPDRPFEDKKPTIERSESQKLPAPGETQTHTMPDGTVIELKTPENPK